jgi:hypothetical protein
MLRKVTQAHSVIIWCMVHRAGMEISCTLISERRYRYNQRMSQNYRDGYPRIGHYVTWKIHLFQLFVESNRGVTLFPYWVNASDNKDTDESFDLVALQSTKLYDSRRNFTTVDETLRGRA